MTIGGGAPDVDFRTSQARRSVAGHGAIGNEFGIGVPIPIDQDAGDIEAVDESVTTPVVAKRGTRTRLVNQENVTGGGVSQIGPPGSFGHSRAGVVGFVPAAGLSACEQMA